MDIITRKEAKSLSLKRYYTGKPCTQGHLSERLSSNGSCITCSYGRYKVWSSSNKEYLKSKDDAYYYSNREEVLEKKADRRQKNPEIFKIKDKLSYQRNRAYVKEKNKRRDAYLKLRTPNWADPEAIRKIYALSTKITEESGIIHHVDHIIPLRGENVSGLHVEYNLRVITAKDNLKKGNKF